MTSGAGGGGESAESSQEHAMLRRRTVWLLGKWCGAGALPTAARPSLYGALVALLREDSLALALTVSRHDIAHLGCILLKTAAISLLTGRADPRRSDRGLRL